MHADANVGEADFLELVGGSGIKKKEGGVATTHRCILRCLTQLGFEAFSVATTLSIASCVGRHFPCDVFFPSEGKKPQKRQSFCSFVLFSYLFRIYQLSS